MTVLVAEPGGRRRMAGGEAARPRPPPLGLLSWLVLLIAATSALGWLVTHESQRGWDRGELAVTLRGEHYRVTSEQLEWLEGLSALHFSAGEEAARELVAAEVGSRLDELFAGVNARLPGFADWYYSLGGEYTRLAMIALAWADLADEDYVANRAARMLFPDAEWNSDLARLESATAARIRAHHEGVRADWLTELTGRLSSHRVPAPLAMSSDARDTARNLVSLDALVAELMMQERAALTTRMSISTVAAGGAMAGPALWRAASRRAAANARRAATAGRAATRGLTRGATRVGSAAAGGALCGPGGPVCAVLAGAAAWLASDWLLLRVDEHINRDQMLEALEQSVSALRDEMERDLLAAYDEMIASYYGSVEQRIHESFVPARAAGNASSPSLPPNARREEGNETRSRSAAIRDVP